MADGFLLLPNLTIGADGSAGPANTQGLVIRRMDSILELRPTGGTVDQREWIILAAGAGQAFRIRPVTDGTNTPTGAGEFTFGRDGALTVPGQVNASSESLTGNLSIGGTLTLSAPSASIQFTGTGNKTINAVGALLLQTASVSRLNISTSGISAFLPVTINGALTVTDTINATDLLSSIVATGEITANGVLRANSQFFFEDTSTGTGTALVVTGTGRVLRDSSSARYKENIVASNPNVQQFLMLKPKQFDYKNSTPNVLGLIAEDAHDLGLQDLLNYDSEGRPESFRQQAFNAHLLAAIQELAKRIAER